LGTQTYQVRVGSALAPTNSETDGTTSLPNQVYMELQLSTNNRKLWPALVHYKIHTLH